MPDRSASRSGSTNDPRPKPLVDLGWLLIVRGNVSVRAFGRVVWVKSPAWREYFSERERIGWRVLYLPRGWRISYRSPR